MILSKTYDALARGWSTEEKARDPAEKIAAYENGLTRIETDIALIRSEIGEIRSTMATKTWVSTGMLAQAFAALGDVAGLLKLLH